MKRTLLSLLMIGLSLAQPGWAASWLVEVDTSVLKGLTGYLDVQFNPADGTAPAATATISNFLTDGALSTPTATGDASGGLPGTLVLGNSQFFNDWLQVYAFGKALSFQLDIDTPKPNASGSGTAFALSLYDSAFNSLLADPAWGAALVLNADSQGAVTTLAQTSPVRLSAAVASVPEANTFSLMAVGFAAVGLSWRRNQKRTLS